MGPPREHGGMVSARPGTSAKPSSLQWGRRVNTAECYAIGSGDDVYWDPLQWGRRVNTAECACDGASLVIGNRFNGAAA